MKLPTLPSSSLGISPSSRVVVPRFIIAALRCTTTNTLSTRASLTWLLASFTAVRQTLMPSLPSGKFSRFSCSYSLTSDTANVHSRFHSTAMAAQSIDRNHNLKDNGRSCKNLSEEEIEELVKVCKFIPADYHFCVFAKTMKFLFKRFIRFFVHTTIVLFSFQHYGRKHPTSTSLETLVKTAQGELLHKHHHGHARDHHLGHHSHHDDHVAIGSSNGAVGVDIANDDVSEAERVNIQVSRQALKFPCQRIFRGFLRQSQILL